MSCFPAHFNLAGEVKAQQRRPRFSIWGLSLDAKRAWVILIKQATCVQKCPSHFKSSCYFQGWQAKPPREACICEQTSHLCKSSHRTGKGISSVRQEGPKSVGPSQMGGQKGKCEVIVWKVLSCELAKYNISQTEDLV